MKMVPIASSIVTVNGSSISFSSIPQTYKHLQIRFYGKSNFSGVAWLYMDFSGGSYYSHTYSGDGATPTSFNGTSGAIATISTGSTPSIFGSAIIDIANYTNTTRNKVAKGLSGFDTNGSGAAALRSILRTDSTAAISTVNLNDGGGGGFVIGTRADLYGVME